MRPFLAGHNGTAAIVRVDEPFEGLIYLTIIVFIDKEIDLYESKSVNCPSFCANKTCYFLPPFSIMVILPEMVGTEQIAHKMIWE